MLLLLLLVLGFFKDVISKSLSFGNCDDGFLVLSNYKDVGHSGSEGLSSCISNVDNVEVGIML